MKGAITALDPTPAWIHKNSIFPPINLRMDGMASANPILAINGPPAATFVFVVRRKDYSLEQRKALSLSIPSIPAKNNPHLNAVRTFPRLSVSFDTRQRFWPYSDHGYLQID